METTLTGGTHKQRRLTYELQQRGVAQDWRAFILGQKAAGLSNMHLALLVTTEYHVPVDVRTISNWLKEARETKSDAAPSPGEGESKSRPTRKSATGSAAT
jgi:hypothetical protein